ncbi:MAG: PAS domain-containing protein [Thermoleophilia bacterium]
MDSPGASTVEAGFRPEEQLRAMFAAMGEGLVVQAADGRITMANAAAARVLGLTEDQLLGRTSMDPRWHAVRADGSPFPGHEHPSMTTLRTGEPQRGVIMGVDSPAHGERRWIQVNSEPMGPVGEDGLPQAAVTTFTDVTALRATEERFRTVVAATHDGMVVVGRDGRIWSANPSVARILGVEAESLAGTEAAAMCPGIVNAWGEPIPAERSPLRSVFATGRLRAGVVIGIDRPDGRRVWAVASWVPLGAPAADGRPEAVLVTLTDITALREAEEALRASEQRYRALYGYQSDAVIRLSPSGELLSASPSVWRVLRFDPNDMPQLDAGLVNPDDLEHAREGFLRMAAGEVGVRYEVRIRRGDGRWIWAEVTGGPVYDDHGTVVEVQHSIRDISGREHRERDNGAMRRVASLLAGGAAADVVHGAVARDACDALPADTVTVLRFAGSRGVPVAVWPGGGRRASTVDLSRAGTAAAEVVAHGSAVAVREVGAAGGRAGMTLAAPVVVGGELWGCVCAGLAEGHFAEGAADRLRVYADLAAAAAAAAG